MDTSLLSKPRIQGPLIKICLEVYHALNPFHRADDDEVTTFGWLRKRALLLFFVWLRWYRFLKDLVNDKKAVNMPLSIREKLSMLLGICGHLLVIYAQNAIDAHETAIDYKHKMNVNGPYAVIRHPHRVGKWLSDSTMSIYQKNKIAIIISMVMLAVMVKNVNNEEAEFENQQLLEQYKRRVPNKFIPFSQSIEKEQ